MSFFADLLTDDSVVTPHLQSKVPANTTAFSHETSWKVEAPGTIEKVTVWHVPGSESALRTKPVVKKPNGQELPIPDYGDGETFITGEPNAEPYRSSQSVEPGDEIVVKATNTNSNYGYRFRVLPHVDYAGGTSRFLGGDK